MKILIATPILYDPTSPFNHLLKDILQGLLDAGHEVTRIVATESADDTAYTMGLDGIRYIPILRQKSEKANIIKRYLSDTLTALRMAKEIKKSDADILFEDVCKIILNAGGIALNGNLTVADEMLLGSRYQLGYFISAQK